ncbi:MAG: DNA repair protein RecN [Bdellovibrionota bacterium]
MLTELKVANFAIIDRVDVFFKKGFNVLSGETGSGKSLLLKSLALLMGDKSTAETIKTGCDQATVEGLFDISDREDIKTRVADLGIEHDDTLVVRRILSKDGKNRVYINGSLSTLQQLREIVSPLVEITGHNIPLIEMTGQHENRNLQSKAYHLEMLDQYLGTTTLRNEVQKQFEQLSQLRNELEDLQQNAKQKTQRLDFLVFQRDEIEGLSLKIGEETELENQMLRLKSSEKLSDFVSQAEEALYSQEDSALVRIHRILSKGTELAQKDPSLQAKLEPLTTAKTLIEEVVYELRDYGQQLQSNPEALQEMEERMSRLRRIQKKYGTSVEQILAELKNITDEISGLEGSESRLESLQAEISKIEKTVGKKAEQLHEKRQKGAKTFEDSVQKELEDLNMKGLLFLISIGQLPAVTTSGISEIEFMIQPSKKDEPRALAKFASGGELSRVLLSLKRVVGTSEYPRTYLFDEVDAGVSGMTAEKVGKKLKSIAKGQQVICITHLPQVAAFADSHHLINKVQSSKGVKTEVIELDRESQVKEIARMLSGEKITKASLDHAKELLSSPR